LKLRIGLGSQAVDHKPEEEEEGGGGGQKLKYVKRPD
jgi:hypothetical protein